MKVFERVATDNKCLWNRISVNILIRASFRGKHCSVSPVTLLDVANLFQHFLFSLLPPVPTISKGARNRTDISDSQRCVLIVKDQRKNASIVCLIRFRDIWLTAQLFHRTKEISPFLGWLLFTERLGERRIVLFHFLIHFLQIMIEVCQVNVRHFMAQET